MSGTTNPLAPAQSAIRFCLASLPAFMAFVDTRGWCAADATADEIEDDLVEAHNVISDLIDKGVSGV